MVVLSQHYPGAVTHSWPADCTHPEVTCANGRQVGSSLCPHPAGSPCGQPDKRHFLHWRTMDKTLLFCACQDYSGKQDFSFSNTVIGNEDQDILKYQHHVIVCICTPVGFFFFLISLSSRPLWNTALQDSGCAHLFTCQVSLSLPRSIVILSGNLPYLP